MGNGKKPETTGEHIVALYGHITGVKRDIQELRQESSQMHEKFEKKFDSLTWWIIGGLGSTIALLLTLSFNLIK
jgi:uncharacterized protein YgiM (DUF1202 family)